MDLKRPFVISSRLMPALEIGGATISMEVESVTNEGRLVYHYFIDHKDFSYENNDIKSGCGNGDLQDGFSALLSFLCHDAEHYRFHQNTKNEFTFDSDSVIEWAYQNDDEIGMLAYELEGTDSLIVE